MKLSDIIQSFVLIVLAVITLSSQANAFTIQSARFNSDNTTNRQLAIQFSAPVALPGAVPTMAHLNAVQLPPDIKAMCNWRFVKPDVLACESQQHFPQQRAIELTVEPTFPGLNGVLGKRFETTLITPLMPLQLQVMSDGFSFPLSLTLASGSDQTMAESLPSLQVTLVAPDGSRFVMRGTEVANSYITTSVGFSLEQQSHPDGTWPEGDYQVWLEAGFKYTSDSIATTKRQWLGRFGVYRHQQILGLACQQHHTHPVQPFGQDLDYIPLRSLQQYAPEQVIDCPSNKLQLVFARDVQLSGNNPEADFVQYGWVRGGQYRVNVGWGQRGVSLVLEGGTGFTLDLNALVERLPTNDALPFKKLPGVIRFTTPAALSDYAITHVESDDISPAEMPKLQFEYAGQPDISYKFHRITSFQSMLDWLNNKPVDLVSRTIDTSDNPQFPVRVDVFDADTTLSENGGVGFLSVDNHLKHKGLRPLPHQLPLYQQGFNLSFVRGDSWLIHSSDWQGRALNGATVRLLCPGRTYPELLGVTDSNGMLFVEQPELAANSKPGLTVNEGDSLLPDSLATCWLWGTRQQQQAAMKIDSGAAEPGSQWMIHGWLSQPVYQPGETIDVGFIIKQRSDTGLKAIDVSEDYDLVVREYNRGRVVKRLSLATVSKRGIHRGTFETAADMASGIYSIGLQAKSMSADDSSGFRYIESVLIKQFDPPSFEYQLDLPDSYSVAQPDEITVSANMLNGEPLSQGKLEYVADVSERYSAPDNWPKDYRFNYNRLQGSYLNERPQNTVLLDQDGRTRFTPDLSYWHDRFPLLSNLNISTTVVSASGERISKRSSTFLDTNPHYIGYKHDKTTNALTLIAVNAQGEQVQDVQASVVTSVRKDGVYEPGDKLCDAQTIPATCQLPDRYGSFELLIDDGDIHWPIHLFRRKPEPERNYQEALTLTLPDKVVAGENIEVELQSLVEGMATIILNAGVERRSWQLPVTGGKQTIPLAIKPEWTPGIELAVFVAQNDDGTNKPQRFFIRESLIIHPTEPLPELKITTPESVVTGGKVQVQLQADTDMDVQLWFFNDALSQVANFNPEQYGFNYSAKAKQLISHSRNQDLYSSNRVGTVYKLMADASRSEMRRRVAPPQFVQFDLNQSVYLETLSLVAGQTLTRDVQLPSLTGRWRVFAVYASDHHIGQQNKAVVTKSPVDYYLEAPTDLYVSDNGSLQLAMQNRSGQHLSDQLTLWLDGNVWKVIPIELAVDQFARQHILLPPLTTGKHEIRMTANSNPAMKSGEVIRIWPDSVEKQQGFWMAANSANKIAAPENYVSGSLQLSARSDSGIPDWLALSQWNQDYPHQCVEQTVSRLMSWQLNPMSQQRWPQGEDTLVELLRRLNRVSPFRYGVGFFPGHGHSDDFLTGYVHFILAELNNPQLQSLIEESDELLLERLDREQMSVLAKSMTLAALAKRQQLTLAEVKQWRSKLGNAGSWSVVLQMLALQAAGAEPQDYLAELDAVIASGYRDARFSVFSQASQQCAVASLLPDEHPSRIDILDQVLQQQQQTGVFGSTFDNAWCSRLVQHLTTQSGESASLSVRSDEAGTLRYQALAQPQQSAKPQQGIELQKGHWLTLRWQQLLEGQTAHINGLSITREWRVQRQGNWQPLAAGDVIYVGEQIETTLTVFTAIEREHLVITDDLAAGLFSNETNNSFVPRHDTQLGYKNVSYENGTVSWYLSNLSSGETQLRNTSAVRFVGDYLVAPATATLMYQSSVFGQTGAAHFTVKLPVDGSSHRSTGNTDIEQHHTSANSGQFSNGALSAVF